MAAPCKFDRKCHRPDCYFSHPNGRECDDAGSAGGGSAATRAQSAMSPASARAAPSAVPCKFDFMCKRADCYFFHPSGRAIDAAGGGGGTPRGGATDLNLPDSPFGAEDAELEAMLEEQEAAADKDTWYPAHRNCNCCRGFVHACSSPMCAELGVCGCTLEDSDIQAAGDAEA